MIFPVKFSATVSGAYIDLDVLIQDELVSSPGGKVAITENYSDHGDLIARFRISGMNGTDFTIKYTCTSSGKAETDPAFPSPVDGTIVKNGFIEILLTIPV